MHKIYRIIKVKILKTPLKSKFNSTFNNTTKSRSHRRPGSSGRFGVALIAAFLLVPLIFIFAYTGSAPSDDVPPADDGNANGNITPFEQEDAVLSGSGHHTDNIEPDASDEEPDNTPAIEIIGTAYLTFDDGPSRTLTPGILDILAEESIKATFFVLPREGADDIFERIIEEGHEIGNHTYSHDYTALFRGSASAFKEDVLKAGRFMSEKFGYTMSSFRFPAGSMTWNRDIRNPRISVLNEIGYTYYDWDIDSGDAHALQEDKGAETITANVLNNTNGKEHVIILMHDFYTRDTTLEALPMIIKGLREQGYEFDIIRKYPG